MGICLFGDLVLVHARRMLRDWWVETVEAIEEGSEEIVLQVHLATEGLPIEASCDPGEDFE